MKLIYLRVSPFLYIFYYLFLLFYIKTLEKSAYK